MEIIDEKVRKKWKNYLWQSAIAGLSIAVILVFFASIVGLVIVAAVGATSFTVFTIPNHKTARARSVFGGQAIGAIVGLICSTFFLDPIRGGVSLAALLMVTLNAEHPPAAGTALGLSIDPSPEGALFVLAASGILSLTGFLLSEYLKDLT
ncbi:hypothetical protein AKJ64_01460 [candidate division MSBL1 archaeon SCGC-AAA259E17]|uniref:HPP transmembrane region domain-containing protein n=1 Tax=candidate division MSBL1 archaeon SCGC-AAA259E17 TaxID=1698263 RepID=A0A133UFX1_9EURY|nr:hypothetical protein AKJ64_01460 [candidate division MSBL1 archaeon SCGC-AAA259E17]